MTKRLKISDKHETKYCVPNWLRDEQIKRAIARVSGRIQPGDKKNEAIAIVGYGPSLNDTWTEIRNFKYVMSCSGAHKFLVERGIIPTWHVEVDPRPHKVELIGPPQKETEYLIASTCHPKVFDHLEGFNVNLWHVYDSTDEGKRILPRGEWSVTGGCDVGMRCITNAAFLGFTEMHCFGIDGSAKEAKHASDHPLGIKGGFAECEYPEGSGKLWLTTAGMLEAAKQIWHELDELQAVSAKFYGEGLVQEMAKHYQRKQLDSLPNKIAFASPVLISDEYKALNEKLHHENLYYGVGGAKHAPRVLKLVEKLNTRSVLDYGCGKGFLARELPFPIWEYDPAVKGKDETPRPADLVVCTDVLEHIEIDRLDFLLDDLRRCTRKCGYFTIHTGPSAKTLADGRNSHLIQQPWDWWKARLEPFFKIVQSLQSGPVIYVVVMPKQQQKSARVSVKAA